MSSGPTEPRSPEPDELEAAFAEFEADPAWDEGDLAEGEGEFVLPATAE